MFQRKEDNWVFWAFLAPVLSMFILVVALPFCIGIYYSFTDWSAIPGKAVHGVGFANYIRAFTDPHFLRSFLVTLRYSLIAVVMINIVGFALALLVTQRMRGANVLRAVFFLPNLIGGLILGFLWKYIFLKILPALGDLLGASFLQANLLADSGLAIFAMAIVSTWQMGGYIMVIYIAAIQSIPVSLIEAARIDGAGAFQRVRHIVFPLVAQAFTISLFLTLSNSFKMFDVNLALTNGGPAGSTELLTLNIYATAYSRLQFAFGQSKAIVFFFIVAFFTVAQVRLTQRREVEA